MFFGVNVFTHVAAVSWFGRWTLCSSPVNHLEGRRHTDVPYGHRMQNERPYLALKLMRELLLVCVFSVLPYSTPICSFVSPRLTMEGTLRGNKMYGGET